MKYCISQARVADHTRSLDLYLKSMVLVESLYFAPAGFVQWDGEQRRRVGGFLGALRRRVEEVRGSGQL
jgi:hypothetical protein